MTRAMLSEVSDFRSRRSRTFRVLVWCVVGAMVLLAGAPVNEQPFETVGVRALGMGGAFVAVADDATANYWNQAGLTDLFFSAVLDVQRTDTRLSPDPFLREGTRDGTTFVSTSAERALETYAWPGNARETTPGRETSVSSRTSSSELWHSKKQRWCRQRSWTSGIFRARTDDPPHTLRRMWWSPVGDQ